MDNQDLTSDVKLNGTLEDGPLPTQMDGNVNCALPPSDAGANSDKCVHIDLFDMEPPWNSSSFLEDDQLNTAEIKVSPIADLPSSPSQFEMPQTPFHACYESPINFNSVAASTPFHGQRLSSTASVDGLNKMNGILETESSPCRMQIARANETFQSSAHDVSSFAIKDPRNLTFFQAENATFEVGPNEKGNATFDTHPHKGNETFHASNITADLGKANISLKDKENLQGNATFDTAHKEKDSSGSEIMDSCTQLESSGESGDGKSHRKPLSSLHQSKASNLSRPGSKRGGLSRITAPRMNTAAISRIQARSPGRGTAKESANDMIKPSSVRSFKKPSTTGSILKARKSLLPPKTGSRKSTIPSPNTKKSSSLHKSLDAETDSAMQDEHTIQTSTKPRPSHSSCTTPTKRKAQESPKRIGRSPKIPGGRAPEPPQIAALKNRSSSAPTSKITSSSSRLSRPSSLKAPSSLSSRLKSNTGLSTKPSSKMKSSLKPPVASMAQSRGITAPSAILSSSGNLRKPKTRPKENNPSSNNGRCATALAILLDYVVNKLDGMSAPLLSKENCQLQKLINDQREANETLSCKVTSLTESHHCELDSERKLREEMEAKLTTELENSQGMCQRQSEEIEEMKSSHEAYVMQLRKEWMEEREKTQMEMQELLDNTEAKIQEEVNERMKPYLSARQEVQSLTAVLEMKNDTIRKLEAQASLFGKQQDEITSLQFKHEQMKQKNEDLKVQLQEKLVHHRNIESECEKVRRSLNEEQNKSTKLYQQNEELIYRLNSISPAASPSFNPVFTTSPTLSDPPTPGGTSGSTPSFAGFRRAQMKKSNSSHSGEFLKDDVTRTLTYNNNNGEEVFDK